MACKLFFNRVIKKGGGSREGRAEGGRKVGQIAQPLRREFQKEERERQWSHFAQILVTRVNFPVFALFNFHIFIY